MDLKSQMEHAFTLLARRDVEGCLALLSDDFRINLAGVPETMVGKQAWLGNAEVLLAAFSELDVRIDDTVVSGDRIVCLVTLSAVHSGEFLGHPATGRRVQWESYEVYRISDGLIREEWICSDLLGLLQQISAGD